jgi:transcriptional regulator with XRE-family HTH domain
MDKFQELNYPQMDRVFPQTCGMVDNPKNSKSGEHPRHGTAIVLGANINALMKASAPKPGQRPEGPDLSSNPKLAKKTKLGTGTISRLRNGTVNANLETLEVIARAFDVQPWQLLVPDMEPGNAPVLQTAGDSERDLYRQFKTIAKQVVSIEDGDR